MTRISLGRLAALCTFPFAATAALADGAGAVSDAAPGFEYTSGVFVAPNMTPFAGDPVPVVCEPGTPTCDVYTLTVDYSDAFRSANLDAFLDLTMAWGGTPVDAGGAATFPDFDMYFYDAAGNLIGNAATSANPELVSLPLDVLPNGSYQVHVIPFMPMGQSFTLTGKLAGTAEDAKSGILGAGGLGLALVLPLALAGLRRRRR